MYTFIVCGVVPILQAQNENELRRLKADLLEMKKARVKLLNQMRAEASRSVGVVS